jgi:hypothetical protein
MRYQVPKRLHWVQVRDAVAAPEGWRPGRLTGVDVDGETGTATIVALDEDGGDGAEVMLTCGRADELATAARRGIAHPGGGHRVLWSVGGRVLALPAARDCDGDGSDIVIDTRAVIVEDKRRYTLLAEDSTWSCLLFGAVDQVALDAAKTDAEERAAGREDRSTLFPKLRTTLLPERD